jgi:hypothetical protein
MALVKTSFFRILSQFFFFLFLRSVVIFFKNWSKTLMFGFKPSFLGSSYTVGYSFNTLSSFLTPHPYRPQTLSRRVYQRSPLS